MNKLNYTSKHIGILMLAIGSCISIVGISFIGISLLQEPNAGFGNSSYILMSGFGVGCMGAVNSWIEESVGRWG